MSSETDKYLLEVTSSTRQYMHDLRQENEVLRNLLFGLSSGTAPLAEQLERAQSRLVESRADPVSARDEKIQMLADDLRSEIELHRTQREALIKKVVEVEARCRRTAEQYADVEQQYANLTNLFVASYRLHETLDRDEVLQILQEIVINIVGSEELGIFELAPSHNSLALVGSFGLDEATYRSIPTEVGVIGRAVRDGKTVVVKKSELVGLPAHESGLTAVIPLKLGEKVLGAIAIFRLLKQKVELTGVDEELFDLLATHGGTALYCTRLHAAERKAAAR